MDGARRDEALVLPSGLAPMVVGIDTAGGPVPEAFPPMSVAISWRR